MSEIKQPRAFRLDPGGNDTSADTRAAVTVVDSADPFDVEREAGVPVPAASKRRFGLWSLFLSAAGAFLALAIGLWGVRFVEDLLAASPLLGWIAAALAVIALIALLLLGVREWLIIRRLGVVERLRQDAATAFAADDRDGARRVVKALLAQFPEAAPDQRAELADHAKAIIDGADLLRIAERQMLLEPDRLASEAVTFAARRVSIVTAISPRPWVDILFVLAQSVRLIRSVAVIYGGRPSGFGSLRLFRRVLGHLALTGGVAMTDSVLSQVVGAGLAARISAKLGEGVLNGVLTARVGIAAIEICRPLPYLGTVPPKLSEIASGLLKRSE